MLLLSHWTSMLHAICELASPLRIGSLKDDLPIYDRIPRVTY